MAGRIAYYGNIVKDGLVLDLDAAKKDSYPGTGTVWRDVSGTGNNGTLTNGPIYDSGNGGSIVFDGTNDSVILSKTSTQMNLDYITISAWVNATTQGQGYVVSAQVSGPVPFHLNIGGNNASSFLDGMAFWPGSGGGANWRNSGITTYIRGDGLWHNVVGTFDGTNLSYYIDGVLNSTSTEGAGFVLPKNLAFPRIGAYTHDNGYFGGKIAMVKIYNRALNTTELLQNYNALKGRFGL